MPTAAAEKPQCQPTCSPSQPVTSGPAKAPMLIAHVVEGEPGVPALVVGAVELADHGGHVGLEQAGARADQAEAHPGHRRRWARPSRSGRRRSGRRPTAPRGTSRGSGRRASRRRPRRDRPGCRRPPRPRRRSGRHAQAAVRDGVGEVEDEDGLHAEEREALPDLQPGEGRAAPWAGRRTRGRPRGAVRRRARRPVAVRDTIHYFR